MARNVTGTKARAPQGAKRVAQAFLDELATIADDKQAAVARAAQGMIRETLAARKEKARAAKAKLKAPRKTSAPPRGKKAATAAPTRPRRSRKPAVEASEVPTSETEAPSEE